MKTLNLAEVTKNIVFKQTEIQDSNITQYIKSTVELLQSQNKDITDYALISVDNPMQVTDGGLKFTSQWRIVKVSEIESRER